MASNQCTAQVSVNGGAWVSGGITAVPFGATINFRNIVSSPRSYQWELYAYPPDLTLPTGWASVGGIYTYFGASPPTVTLPASGANAWGKIPIRLTINGNPLQFNPDGSLNPAYDPDYVDTSTILSVKSPNLQLEGICIGESTQFDTLNAWTGALMRMLRAIDTAL